MAVAIEPAVLSRVIGQAYQSALDGSWEPLLRDIKDLTESNKAFMLLQSSVTQQPLKLELVCDFDFPGEALVEYQQQPYTEDPCFQTTRLLTEGETHYCNEYIDLTTLKDDTYFQKVFVPLKAFHVLVGICCRNNEYDAVIAVNRDEGDSAYDTSDKQWFELLMPHLTRALHIYTELGIYKQQNALVQSVLDQEDKAVFICDEKGCMHLTNQAGDALINADPMFAVHGDKLVLTHSVYHNKLREVMSHCCQLSYKDIHYKDCILIERDTKDTLQIVVAPIVNKKAFNGTSDALCLVTIKQEASVNWPLFKAEFGLTQREFDLVRALYQKQRLNDLTKVFNVSYNTLRTHLQAVFKKLGIHSQTELMLKISLF